MKKQDYKKMVMLLALGNALLIRGYIDREIQIREEKIKELDNNSNDQDKNEPTYIPYENPYIDLGDGYYKSKEDGSIYKKETNSVNATRNSDDNYVSYACPSGYTLSGTTCTKTTMQLYSDEQYEEEAKQLKRK